MRITLVLLGLFACDPAPPEDRGLAPVGTEEAALRHQPPSPFSLPCMSTVCPGVCGGVCPSVCPPPPPTCNDPTPDACGKICTNLQTSTSHCGHCTTHCGTAHTTGTPMCVSGVCTGTTCVAGFGDCNAWPNDGCETDLTSSLGNCGSCGKPCSPNHVDNSACTGGTCTGTCSAGYTDCNGDLRTDGCEVDLMNDANHCGSCTAAPCPGTANGVGVCIGGACTVSCNDGFYVCNGACITNGACCGDSMCTSPPDFCHNTQGHCVSNACQYDQITCPILDCQNASGCSASGCLYSNQPVGTACGGSGCFTASGASPSPTCQLDGNNKIYCNGMPKDCTKFDGPCSQGVCDAMSGACTGLPINNGMACTANGCTINATCGGGTCRGQPRDCGIAPVCHVASCDVDAGACKTDQLAMPGASCANTGCVVNPRCDGNGVCGGTPSADGTPCSGCDGNGMCLTGVCTCPPDLGGMPSPEPDLGVARKPAAKGCGGCAASRAEASGGGALALLALFLMLALRRARTR